MERQIKEDKERRNMKGMTKGNGDKGDDGKRKFTRRQNKGVWGERREGNKTKGRRSGGK